MYALKDKTGFAAIEEPARSLREMTPKLLLLTLLVVSGLSAQQAAFVVGEKIGNSVGFYDSAGKRIGGVEVGIHPHEMVLSPDGRYLYVSDNGILWMTDPGSGGNTISIIDVKERKKAGVIDLGEYRRPHGIDLDPNSPRLVVTIENPDGLLLIDREKRTVLRKYDVKGEDPHMVLLGPKAEWAYVSNTATATIAAVHLESGEVKLIPTDARPQGAVRSHDGKRIYVTNSDGNSISIIDNEKKERVATIKTGAGPGRIALTPDGKTLVYNLGAGHAVGFADVASGKEVALVPIGGQPLSLTMSADGKFAYAGIQDQDKVVVVSVPERKIARTFQTPKQAGPDPVLPLL
jgi:YVTN family beta-propeller protein